MMTPTTMAMPMATGKATASPARSMAATSSRLATLKMNPPIMAETMLPRSAALTFSRKPSPAEPVEPSVKA
jgi:hypothetical protein